MKILIGQRSSGTTTNLLLEASKFKEDALFITCSHPSFLRDKCIREGIDPPTTIGYIDLIAGNFDKNKKYHIFIDNVDLIVKGWLNGFGVKGNLETASISMEAMHEGR